jgi:hypothetical protein
MINATNMYSLVEKQINSEVWSIVLQIQRRSEDGKQKHYMFSLARPVRQKLRRLGYRVFPTLVRLERFTGQYHHEMYHVWKFKWCIKVPKTNYYDTGKRKIA